MEKVNMKAQILNEALELFSKRGFEATSIAQIAEAVGLKKASLYSHFASKQDILDTLLDVMEKKYSENSILSKVNWDNPEFIKDMEKMSAKDLGNMVKRHIIFIIHEPGISKMRKFFTIEQFRNEKIAKVQTQHSYEDILKFSNGLIRFLIKKGDLVDDNPDIIAAQFAWPVSIWINLCDREPEREAEVLELVDRHIHQMLRIYKNNDNS
ncbi:DNA-binding transcriptional regulator, AcrR family [Acetitomaculum ruminis DSM 5522]|uniref:DNA-binding transcriptional regulator, AcrR family n=1 Tax=Acetitomaculum ruminis DSM 5522 TaxID=1120918 RepID=A0A1I1AAP4_9FIRM|nr:TetR/AcrR family transcriptional regulator [Acetitomaculum ruminis]SFB33588.1 DNA-binding transcriptional regulator, AcrR family [Acetitomaculum ruminis DSM 5522]